MKEINVYISLLSDVDRKNFIDYLSNRNKRSDVKNIELFKALASGGADKMRSSMTANAYNVLLSRLKERIIDFISGTQLNSEATLEIKIIKKLLVARKMFTYEHPKLGFKLIEKAEEMATSVNHYTLLSEIYHTVIEQSHHQEAPDQEIVFQKFEKNQKNINEQERLNMAYAIVRKAFKSNEHKAKTIDLSELVDKTYASLGIKDDVGYSFQSLYQLALIADITGAYQRDYHSVDLFFVDKLDELASGPMDSEKSLQYHIDILYLAANISFRKKLFVKSQEFLEQMNFQMKRFNKKLYSENKVAYITLNSFNFIYINDSTKAIREINTLMESKLYSSNKLLNPRLILAMTHFLHGDFKEAQHILTSFNRNDNWYERHIGVEWLLQKKHMEILLHIELGNSDYVESRITSLQRKYSILLDSKKDDRVNSFLKLVRRYFNNPEIVTTEKFKQTVEKSFFWKSVEEEDIILMSFFAWLKSKMEGRSTYEVLLEMVKLPATKH